MHRITTPKNPVVVETIVSGTSTPSSIGEVRPNDEVEQVIENLVAYDPAPPRFVLEWVTADGEERSLGRRSGGLAARTVVNVIELLVRHRIATVFTVGKV